MTYYTIRDILNKFDLELDIGDEFLDCNLEILPEFDDITDYSIETEFEEKVFVFKGKHDTDPKYSFELKLAKKGGNIKNPSTFEFIIIEGNERRLVYVLIYNGNTVFQSD